MVPYGTFIRENRSKTKKSANNRVGWNESGFKEIGFQIWRKEFMFGDLSFTLTKNFSQFLFLFINKPISFGQFHFKWF